MSTNQSATHPKGLYVLFATEMWERFNFYGMRAILTLFLVNALAFSDAEASVIYGGFLGLCYLTPLIGGFISDRYLGNRHCITIGGLTMGVGQMFLFASASMFSTNLGLATNVMWVALGIIIMGNGFFKPNISSMVGQLYKKGDSKLDSAFTIFYMGINVGAFLGMTICAIVADVKNNGERDVSAFKYGFLAAAIAMMLGVIVFNLLKNKFLKGPNGAPVGRNPKHNVVDHEAVVAKFSNNSVMLWSIIGVSLVLIFRFAIDINWIYSFIYSAGIALAGLILSDSSLTKQEKDRIITLYMVAFFVIFFWACFEQAGSSLTFIADKQTDTNLFGWDMPPSLVQNANSLFIVLFAPIFSMIWLWMSKKNIEPMSPVKQAFGLILLAIGFLIIAFQVKGLGMNQKIGVSWLLLMYLLHTLGELCLSPIGLSLVSKLAPLRFSSLLMGVWFLGNASGYALAGTLGALIPPTGDKYELAQSFGINLQGVLEKTVVPTLQQLEKLKELKISATYPSFLGVTVTNLFEFFMVFVILPGAAAVLLLLISPRLKKMMHGVK